MKKYIVIFISLLTVLCVSCGKSTESKLVGTWRVVTVGNCGWDENATWTFYSGGSLLIDSDHKIGGAGKTQTGSWEVFTRSLVSPFVNVEGFDELYDLNGHWRVEKVNSNKLILNRTEWADGQTPGAFLRREFVKQ